MHTGYLCALSLVLLLAPACQGGPGVPEAGPLPVHLHALSGTPGCFVPRPTSAEGEPTSMTEQLRQFYEMNLSFNLQYVGLIVHTILEEPYAEQWELSYTSGELTTVTTIDLLAKSERHTELRLEGTTEGWVLVSMTEKEWVSRQGTNTIVADSRSTRYDTPAGWYRWSDFTVEATEPQATPQVQADGTLASVVTTVTTVRGCDPNRGVSFAQGYAEPLHCWHNDTGAEVSCEGVELWP